MKTAIAAAGEAAARGMDGDSMEEERFEGSANPETYIVKRWLTDESRAFRLWRLRTRRLLHTADARGQAEDSRDEVYRQAARSLASQLERSLWEAAPVGMADVFSDLMLCALDRVDWLELAGEFLDAVKRPARAGDGRANR